MHTPFKKAVVAEQGDAYLMTEGGDVWRVRMQWLFGHEGPVIEQVSFGSGEFPRGLTLKGETEKAPS